MAEALVGGAFLSASLQVLFDRIASHEFLDFFNQRKDINELLRKIRMTLLLINSVLNDAEEKKIKNSAVKEWVNELKDAAYNVQDLIDEITTDASLNKLKAEQRMSTSKQRDLLGLKEGGGKKPSQKFPMTSLVEESGIYGMDGDKEAIIELLLADDVSGDNISVIPIVGMGGVGKNTLAQLVHNKKLVMEHFDVRAWISVSQEFDILRITKTILQAVTSSTGDTDDLDLLQDSLNKSLVGRKFLIVLDDVWNENYLDWDILQNPLKSGADGSRLILTTFPTYHLKHLTDEDCWILFAKHAFGNREFGGYPEMGLIGKKIVRKCNDLPLAAKTLGGLLRMKFDPMEWPCFGYCSISPKNLKFKKEELVLLWMAEDFLLHPKRENLEEVGIESVFVSGEFCSRMETNNSYVLLERTPYFSYSRMMFDAYEKFEAFHGAKGMRSFLPSNVSVRSGCLSTKVILHLLPELRSLRVLSLSHYRNLTVLPDSICNLKQLRYLDISHTAIKVLLHSVCTIYNLQTLLLSCCCFLTELPSNMRWLINLRHLDISGTNLIEMPLLLDRLKSLQTLTSFILGNKGGSGLKELRELRKLKGSLSILKLENVVDARDALEANLRDKLQLNELVLKWGGDTDDSKKDTDVLDQLHPHYCLSLPTFGKLPSLKNLSILGLDGVVNIGTEFYGTGASGSRPFGSLENLRFKNMSELQEWLPFTDDNGGAIAFPCLQQLCIQNCPKLSMALVIDKCQQLVASLSSAPAIRQVRLQYCHKVVLNGLPPQVLKLKISGYDNLDSLPKDNNCLEELDISDCPISHVASYNCSNFASFPVEGLPAPNLTRFSIDNCNNLKALPDQMHTLLPSLQTLSIQLCTELESFPDGGLPTSLYALEIFFCDKLFSSRTEWGLQGLLSLRSFCIRGRSVNVDNELQHFTTLKKLGIGCCPNLQSMPEEGLPKSLSFLSVKKCPLLKTRWLREKGKDWSKIAHIPIIKIDEKVI
ncbi:hypothetical protein ACJW31_11G165200 [Castanea mollissima]